MDDASLGLLLEFISVLIGALAMAVAIGVAVGFSVWLSEKSERRERRSLQHQFRSALGNGIAARNVTWDDVKIIAENHCVTLTEIRDALISLAAEILQGDPPSGDATDIVVRAKDLLRELDTEEPFQGLPEPIQKHLEAINRRLSKDQDNHLLRPLTDRLKELLEYQTKTHQRQRLINSASLLSGLVGAIFGVLAFLP